LQQGADACDEDPADQPELLDLRAASVSVVIVVATVLATGVKPVVAADTRAARAVGARPHIVGPGLAFRQSVCGAAAEEAAANVYPTGRPGETENGRGGGQATGSDTGKEAAPTGPPLLACALLSKGVRFPGFHTASLCWSRASRAAN
jgi:hypothetical protein